jgi:hypothetical protein
MSVGIKEISPMGRGLGQVLFNYLPEATLDYDKGGCICKVAEVRINQEAAECIDQKRILEEIRNYISEWGDNSDLKIAHTFIPRLFAFGEPEEIRFNVYPLVFECRNCRAAFSYQNETAFLKNSQNYKCRWCGGRLGQIYHILVHQCGEMKQLWVPKCNNPIHKGQDTPVMLDLRGSQKAMDFRWKCMNCGSVINKPIYRKCDYCAEKDGGEDEDSRDKSLMRPIPHRANAAYYAHHITKVNVSREDVQPLQDHPQKERILVDAYLESYYKTEDLLRGIVGKERSATLSEQTLRKAQKMPEGPEKEKWLDMARTMKAMEEIDFKTETEKQVPLGITDESLDELFDYIKLRGTCQIKTLKILKNEMDRKFPGRGRLFDKVQREHLEAGIREISLVEDFPVITAVFGYTRVSAEPELRIGDRTIKTRFRRFPTFRMSSEKLQDRIPIFTRVSKTEGLLVCLDPVSILKWLKKRIVGGINDIPTDEKTARIWLLRNVGNVDRFVTAKGMSEITRHVFGLVHTLSHMFVRAAASRAGVDRTGFSEYLFPHIGAFVVYNANTEYNLGGITTLFEEELDILLNKVRYDPLARECMYDPICLEQMNGSCHACTHLGEMACGFFNRGMRRDYVFGSTGYWGV